MGAPPPGHRGHGQHELHLERAPGLGGRWGLPARPSGLPAQAGRPPRRRLLGGGDPGAGGPEWGAGACLTGSCSEPQPLAWPVKCHPSHGDETLSEGLTQSQHRGSVSVSCQHGGIVIVVRGRIPGPKPNSCLAATAYRSSGATACPTASEGHCDVTVTQVHRWPRAWRCHTLSPPSLQTGVPSSGVTEARSH